MASGGSPGATGKLPLDGIRVVDFGQLIAAPLATMILAELGADVIKVESPAGDPGRRLRSANAAPDKMSPAFAAYNRNKRSIILDLKDPSDRVFADQLVAGADVVVQSFRPGVMDRLGLGAEQLRSRHPELIYASISAFGAAGPDGDRPGVDMVIQAESGIMEITGHHDGPPTKVGFTVVDAAAGNILAQAILAALFARLRGGKGDHVQLSLLDVALHLQAAPMGEHLQSGRLPQRVGNSAPLSSPADLMRTNDGFIVISAYFADQWDVLCAHLGRPDLTADDRFSTNDARVANRQALISELEKALVTESTEHWAKLFVNLGLVVGRVRGYSEVVASEQVRVNELIVEVDDRQGGVSQGIRLPFKFDSAGLADRRSAPRLGEHSEEIRQEVSTCLPPASPRLREDSESRMP